MLKQLMIDRSLTLATSNLVLFNVRTLPLMALKHESDKGALERMIPKNSGPKGKCSHGAVQPINIDIRQLLGAP